MTTTEELMSAAKLMLIEETKKNYRLKEVFAEQFGKEFDEKEVEMEIKKNEVD